jgi:hypothetical protein
MRSEKIQSRKTDDNLMILLPFILRVYWKSRKFVHRHKLFIENDGKI